MLVIVRHRKAIDVTQLPEWLAARDLGRNGGDALNETLVDAGEEDIPVLEKLAGVAEVVPAPFGWFFGDGGPVFVHTDGSWSSIEH